MPVSTMHCTVLSSVGGRSLLRFAADAMVEGPALLWPIEGAHDRVECRVDTMLREDIIVERQRGTNQRV